MVRAAGPRVNAWLHRFAMLTAAATFFLVIAGGLVTSTGSGLAVPDWPLSYGQFFPPMVGGIFFEHGHRMIAGTVGLLTCALATWLWFGDGRRWVRWMGIGAVGAVLAQAALGGITVLFLLPTPVSVSHAGLAMAFFALVSSIALVTGPGWFKVEPREATGERPTLPRAALIAATAVYVQILLGATVRHTGSGLACPDFPLCNGQLFPAISTASIGFQLLHRVGALVVAVLVLWVAWRVRSEHPDLAELQTPTLIAFCLLVLQILLGALTVWTGLAVTPTTTHVATGALLLVTMVILTLRLRHRYSASGALPAAPNSEQGVTA
jgi:cytochrome c oxidase assembly protein subunit 15